MVTNLKSNIGGFTLVEILLSLCILCILSSCIIICLSPTPSPEQALREGVNKFYSLQRYTKAYAEINGKRTAMLISSNEVFVQIENIPNSECFSSILQLESNVNDINGLIHFSILSKQEVSENKIILIVFNPDGSVQEATPFTMYVPDSTNTESFYIDEYSRLIPNYNSLDEDTINE